jgi:hypothetical protein
LSTTKKGVPVKPKAELSNVFSLFRCLNANSMAFELRDKQSFNDCPVSAAE